jgi:hypothetical protein
VRSVALRVQSQAVGRSQAPDELFPSSLPSRLDAYSLGPRRGSKVRHVCKNAKKDDLWSVGEVGVLRF